MNRKLTVVEVAQLARPATTAFETKMNRKQTAVEVAQLAPVSLI